MRQEEYLFGSERGAGYRCGSHQQREGKGNEGEQRRPTQRRYGQYDQERKIERRCALEAEMRKAEQECLGSQGRAGA